MNSVLRQNWYPIASSSDLPFRHVFHAQLLGREFAVWRADDGNVNVWENRCLHRGVRLSIGINEGTELRCQYHGWRYANRTAGCTDIPAHPADAPARTICNNTYPVKESMGMIWTGEEALDDNFGFNEFSENTVLRPITVNAPIDLINEKLIEEYSRLTFESKLLKDGSIEIKLDNSKKIIFFVQPQDSKLSVIRGVLNQTLTGDERYNFLKNHNFICERLRSKIDAITHELMIEPMVAKISQVSEDLAKMPLSEEGGRKSDIKVVVSEKRLVSEGVVSLKLEGIRAQLPTFQPGAHIDLHLQNGLIRQYSLLNGPGETDCYRIGVKLEDVSTGGSEFIHKNIREGDLLAISMPRNNFPLRRDSIHTVFIAGGIGLTPLLSMSQVLHGMGLNYELHYFVRDEKHVSFNEVLKKLGKNVSIHAGLSPESTLEKISEIVQNPMKAKNLYACGPGPMLEATLKIASDLGWPDDSVHFEYFKNTKEINDKSSFEIELARSALSLNVPSGKTVLEVLKSNGIDLPSSCEQGACGTCKVNVIEGEVDHQDVYLNSSEKAEGKVMMTCVSRAISKRLILDI